MSKWKIFSEKTVFRTKLFKVIATSLALPNKKKRTYHTAERNPSVFIFPITKDYEIYFVKQYRYSLKKQMIEAAAGFIDDNEKPLDAAKRELKEETGLSAKKWTYLGNIELAASVFRSQAEFFLARDLKIGKQNLDEAEDISLIKMPVGEALKTIGSENMNESGTMLGVLLIDKLRRENKI